MKCIQLNNVLEKPAASLFKVDKNWDVCRGPVRNVQKERASIDPFKIEIMTESEGKCE